MLRASALSAPRFARPSTWLTPSHRPVVGSIASSLYGQAVLIVTGVVVARALGPTDRGHLAFILLLESIVRQVGSLGLPVATTFFIARNRAQAYDVVRTVRTPALIQAALLTVVQAVLLWIFVAGHPERVWLAGLVTLALVPLVLGQEYAPRHPARAGTIPRVQHLARSARERLRRNHHSAVRARHSVADSDHDRLPVVPIIVFTPPMLYLALRGMHRRARTEDVPSRRRIFGFGIRGYLGGVSPIETFRLDQSVIGIFLSPKALGLYVVALSFTNLPRFIALSVGAIAFPRAAQDFDVSGRRTMWHFTFLTIALTALLVVALEVVGRLARAVLLRRGLRRSGRRDPDPADRRILLRDPTGPRRRRQEGSGFPASDRLPSLARGSRSCHSSRFSCLGSASSGVATAIAISSAFSLVDPCRRSLRTPDRPASRRGRQPSRPDRPSAWPQPATARRRTEARALPPRGCRPRTAPACNPRRPPPAEAARRR